MRSGSAAGSQSPSCQRPSPSHQRGLGRREPQLPAPGSGERDASRRRLGERDQVVEAGVHVRERAEEPLAEARLPSEALADAVDAGHVEGRQLAGEVGGGDAHDAADDRRAGLVADRHVQRRRVAPEVEPEPVVQDLVALEAEPTTVVGRQHHRVPHVPGVDVGGVLLREAEAAVLHPHAPGRECGDDDGPAQATGGGGVLEHRRQVVDVDGEHELEAGAVGLALRRPALGVAFRGGAGPADHPLGEAQAGGGGGRCRWQRRRGARPDRPPLLGRQQLDRPLAERGDREERVHREGTGHDGAVGDQEPVVDLGALTGEHLPAVVDHADAPVVAHGAAAERVHGDQALAEHRRPHGVGDVLGGHGGRQAAQRVGVVVEDRQVTGGRPVDPHRVVDEPQGSVAHVVAHHEVRQRAVGGTTGGVEGGAGRRGDPAGDALRERQRAPAIVDVGRHRERRGHQRPQRARDGALLDQRSLARGGHARAVDDPRDAGADGRVRRDRPAAGTDAPHGAALHVVGEGEHVAVAGEALAQPGGDGQAALARAVQDLGRSEGAGREDDDVGEHERGRGREPAATVGDGLEDDGPGRVGAGGGPLDRAHRDLAEDVGAVRHRVGQVVLGHRVLGPVVAPADAVAAEVARPLLDAGGVGAVAERDVDRGPGHRVVGRLCGQPQDRQLGRLLPGLGVRRRAEHALGPLEVGGELGGAHVLAPELGRPPLVVDPRLRAQGHAGVDERRSAEPAADDHAEVVAGPEVEQAGGAPEPAGPAAHLELPCSRGGRLGEVAGRDLAPALEHAHRPTRPGEPGRGDGPAVPRAHDHDVVARRHVAVAAREGGRRRCALLGCASHGSQLPIDHVPALACRACRRSSRRRTRPAGRRAMWAGPAAGRPTARVQPCGPARPAAIIRLDPPRTG